MYILNVPLRRAVYFFGGPLQMARALGVPLRDVWWMIKIGRVTGPQAEKIETLTSGAVSAEELRPDIFPRERQFNRVRDRKMAERVRVHAS